MQAARQNVDSFGVTYILAPLALEDSWTYCLITRCNRVNFSDATGIVHNSMVLKVKMTPWLIHSLINIVPLYVSLVKNTVKHLRRGPIASQQGIQSLANSASALSTRATIS